MREIDVQEAVRQTPGLRPWGNLPAKRRQSGSASVACV
jgi:hypothetical protein